MPKVVTAFPPNYKQICAAIPGVLKNKAICFTYGDTVYNPAGATLQPHFLAHEHTHIEQQKDPDEWWAKYLADPQFRLEQEIEAYRVQYQFAARHGNRDDRRFLLKHIARDLSGPMYGNLLTKAEAVKAITS